MRDSIYDFPLKITVVLNSQAKNAGLTDKEHAFREGNSSMKT